MNESDGVVTKTKRRERLCRLVEDSLVLSSEEKLALLGKLDHLKECDRQKLFEVLLDERRVLDRLRWRAYESEELK